MTLQEQDATKKLSFIGVRHVQVILLFFLLTIGVGMRMQLSVAIVAMTDNSTSSNPDIPTYDWDNKSVILSSFYWGYLTLQLLAAALGKMYGPKYLLIGAMFFSSTACNLIPLMAEKLGSYGIIGCRIFQGISQGFFFPSIYNLLGSWAPVSERSKLTNIATAGYAFGSIVTTPVVGYISSSSIGWPFTFYLFGCMGYVWMIMWIFFGASSPAHHKKIPKEEKEYIERSLEVVNGDKLVVPWRSILTSVPVWVLAVTNVGLSWASLTLGTELPTYLNSVMKFDMESNSLLSTAPSLAAFLASFVLAPFSDYLINTRGMSRGIIRKLFTSVATCGNALAMFVVAFLPNGCNTLTMVMFITTGLFHCFTIGGTSVNQIDLSPNFAGIIMAITNTVGVAVGMMAPLVVQALVTDETDKSQWKGVFLITAGLCLATNFTFLFFSSVDVQEWNSRGKETDQVKDTPEMRKISRKISLIMQNV